MATIVDLVDYVIVLKQEIEKLRQVNEALSNELKNINNDKKQ